MKLTRKNHPWERIFAGRDEINREESSLRENFADRDEINGEESSLRENFAGRDEINIAEGPAFLELPLGEILNPTTFRIDSKGKQNWQHWRNNG